MLLVINLFSCHCSPYNCFLVFLYRFPLWSARPSSWPGRHMQWCLCGQPGAFTFQAPPASSRVSLPSPPASTTRSSTLAWAQNFARTSLYCCHAHAIAGRWCICSTSKTSNLRRSSGRRRHHFLSRSRWPNMRRESWTNSALAATPRWTALLRSLHRPHRRPSTLTCPHTLRHQSTGATGSERLALIREMQEYFHISFTSRWCHWTVCVTDVNKFVFRTKADFTPAHFQLSKSYWSIQPANDIIEQIAIWKRLLWIWPEYSETCGNDSR